MVSSISTVGNYEYGFYWYFYLDGTIQLEVKLTGIMSTQAVGPGEATPFAARVAPGLAAPVHQHLFNARLDLEVDGAGQRGLRGLGRAAPDRCRQSLGQRLPPGRHPLGIGAGGPAGGRPGDRRHWRFVNPARPTGWAGPVAYKLVPGPTPTMLAQPDSSSAGGPASPSHNLWVTPYAPDERRAAGTTPTSTPGGDGLPRWTAADRSLLNTDIVAWYTFGVTHLPRPEDWPVMPVEYCGFHLVPVGFFDRNPSLDVPPPASHCE